MIPFALFELKGRKTEHTPRRKAAEERQLQCCCLQALSTRLGAVGQAVSWEARAIVLQRGSLRLSNGRDLEEFPPASHYEAATCLFFTVLSEQPSFLVLSAIQ